MASTEQNRRNRRCVNPGHLEPVTNAENILRGDGTGARFARRTHCAQGHEFTPENTLVRPEGGRRCRACEAIRTAARDWTADGIRRRAKREAS